MSISQPKILLFGSLSIFVIGIIDYIITIDLSLSICYLIPIFIVTRYVARTPGIFLSVFSGVTWYLAEYSAKTNLNVLLSIWNAIVILVVFLIIVFLLSALKDAYEREKDLARIDGLTKTYNRRYFFEILQIERKRAIRYQRCLTLVYIDVDNFKTVNDRFGHAKGDELLCLISNTILNSLRETDIVARLGGDEFALLLPETEYESAGLVLRRIQTKLTLAVQKNSFEVGFSMGAATFKDLPDSVDKAIEMVDTLMYHVKNDDKNGLKHQLVSLTSSYKEIPKKSGIAK